MGNVGRHIEPSKFRRFGSLVADQHGPC
jgi:hypothetical protein